MSFTHTYEACFEFSFGTETEDGCDNISDQDFINNIDAALVEVGCDPVKRRAFIENNLDWISTEEDKE